MPEKPSYIYQEFPKWMYHLGFHQNKQSKVVHDPDEAAALGPDWTPELADCPFPPGHPASESASVAPPSLKGYSDDELVEEMAKRGYSAFKEGAGSGKKGK